MAVRLGVVVIAHDNPSPKRDRLMGPNPKPGGREEVVGAIMSNATVITSKHTIGSKERLFLITRYAQACIENTFFKQQILH